MVERTIEHAFNDARRVVCLEDVPRGRYDVRADGVACRAAIVIDEPDASSISAPSSARPTRRLSTPP